MDLIIADISKQFITKKFKQYIAKIDIIVKNTLIKAYYFINMIKHYHKPLQQVYLIIISKIFGIKPNLVVQIFFKTINNLIDPNRLVFILLIFDVYSRIIDLDPPSSVYHGYKKNYR